MDTPLLLETHWGLTGELSPLPGVNENLLVESVDGLKSVLKLTTEIHADLDLEEAMLDRLRAEGIPVPTSLQANDGRTIIAEDGCRARLQSFLPGSGWGEVGSSASLLYAIGRKLAEIHAALVGLELECETARRTHEWDLARAGAFRHLAPLLEDRELRRVVEHCLFVHDAVSVPCLEKCPRGVLHGDFNDENILIDGDEVVGVLDMGDCLYGAYVTDLAITLAYALRHEGVTAEVAEQLVKGYESIRPLEAIEQSLLMPLALARLSMGALIAAECGGTFSHQEQTAPTILRFAETTVQSTNTLRSRREKLLGGSLSLSYDEPLHITQGRGQYLFSRDGQPYLDLVNNVCHVGHCHPKVVSAIAEQASALNTNTRYLHENVLEYAKQLTATLPESLDTCFFVNSGSEANELALRLARAATGAYDAIVIDGAYHGNTSNCVAMSPYKFNGPGGSGQADWVHVAPMPDLYRGEIRDDGRAYALELARVIGEGCARGRSIGAFFAEPILSCGGQIPLPEGYLAAAFAHVRAAGGVCIADEVQVGFGRVGHSFWAFERHEVVPDIVVMGKPIGNGHPMAAVVTTREIAEAFNNGMEYFSTFGGNPVSAACGLAVLDVLQTENLQAHALELGQHFSDGLKDLASRHELIGDVRGEGLFLGIELVQDRATLEPAAKEASSLVNALKDQGVLLSTDGPLHNVIKIKPPLVIEVNDVDMVLRLLDDGLSTLEM